MSIVLDLNRSDDMLDQNGSLKQIEINTIAPGGCGVSARTPDVHRDVHTTSYQVISLNIPCGVFFLNKAYYYFIIRHILKRPGQLDESKHVLDDNPSVSLAKGLAKAWDLYGSERWVSRFSYHFKCK